MKTSKRTPFSKTRTTLACRFLIVVFVASLPPPAFSDDAEDQIKSLFDSYFALFNAEDPERLASQIFQPPVQFSNGKLHGIWNSESDVARGFAEALAALRAQGWDKSVISNISACLLIENYALVELSYSRLDVDGDVILPRKRKGVYVVLRTDDGWRIIADYAQRPGLQISCSS